jgi:hypothetical protein
MAPDHFVGLSHDGPSIPRPDLVVRSQFREGPESAHPRHCFAVQRRSLPNPIADFAIVRCGPHFVEFTTHALQY